jgi:two-component system, OmpR family, sensor histidine kinase KdpD
MFTSERANRADWEWTAVFVETRAYRTLAERERDDVARMLDLVRHLGGKVARVFGRDVAEELNRYAETHDIEEIIVGSSSSSRLDRLRGRGVVNRLLRRVRTAHVRVVGTGGRLADPRPDRRDQRTAVIRVVGRYAFGAGAVAGAALVSRSVAPFVALPNLSLVFLTAVLFAAVTWGLGVSIVTSILAAVTYNFLFFPPVHTFMVHSADDVLTLAIFLLAAVLTGNLAGRVRRQAETAKQRESTTAALYSLSREIAEAVGLGELLAAICEDVSGLIDARVVILLPDGQDGALTARYPSDAPLDSGEEDIEFRAVMSAWEHARPAGRDTDVLPQAVRQYLPLHTANGVVAVLGVELPDGQAERGPAWRGLLAALLDQSAVAIERVQLSQRVDQATVEAETERLRSVLLLSVSHDLRTPLASIIGAATGLLERGAEHTQDTHQELVTTIRDEALRLNQFVGNLLGMAQLEAGVLKPNLEWVQVEDMVGAALTGEEDVLRNHRTRVEIDQDLPMLQLDFVLMRQVLSNLLSNAAKYSPPNTDIEILGYRDGESVVVEVTDCGVGIPSDDLPHVFEKFYQIPDGDLRRAGAGLGLAICKGMVDLHDGQIRAASPTKYGQGATLSITLPASAQSPSVEGDGLL